MSKERIRNQTRKVASLIFLVGLGYSAFTLFDINKGLKAEGTVETMGSTKMPGEGYPAVIVFEDERFVSNRFTAHVPNHLLNRLDVGDRTTVLYEREDPIGSARHYAVFEFWLGPISVFILAGLLILFSDFIAIAFRQ